MKNRARGRLSHGNKSKMVAVRFPVDLLEKAKKECQEKDLRFSSVLISLVERWMEEKQNG